MPNVIVVNVVATADLQQRVDLEKIGCLQHGTHDEMCYGGRVAYLKTPEMRGRVTIFPNGKIIGVGTRSRREAIYELKLAAKILVEAGLARPVSLNVRVRNAVATADIGKGLDLNRFAGTGNGIVYEPEQFPGAICRFPNLPEITVLLFTNGKAVITGIRDPDSLDPIVHEILRLTGQEH